LAIALRSTAETAGGVSLPGEINSPPGPINLVLAFYLEYNKKLGIWISSGAGGWNPWPHGGAASANPGFARPGRRPSQSKAAAQFISGKTLIRFRGQA
jgi:hypothetical protein